MKRWYALPVVALLAAVVVGCSQSATPAPTGGGATTPAMGAMSDGMSKDGMAKDSMMQDGMAKDGMMKDGMKKDGMAKDKPADNAS